MFHFRCYILKGSPFNVKLYKRPKHDINFCLLRINQELVTKLKIDAGWLVSEQIEPNFDPEVEFLDNIFLGKQHVLRINNLY